MFFVLTDESTNINIHKSTAASSLGNLSAGKRVLECPMSYDQHWTTAYVKMSVYLVVCSMFTCVTSQVQTENPVASIEKKG